MKKYALKAISLFLSLVSKWIIVTDIFDPIKVNDNLHLVFMTDEEYKEWVEYSQNLFIVYENEKELKKDFPDAERIERYFDDHPSGDTFDEIPKAVKW
jgi:hypothetical protein